MCVPIIGAVISGIGSAMSAMAAADQADAQAELHRRQQIRIKESGAFKADLAGRKADRVQAEQRSVGIASGIDISSGSALEASIDQAKDIQLDIDAIRWNTGESARDEGFKAEQQKAKAKSARTSAVFEFISPVIGGLGQGGGGGGFKLGSLFN